jgi:hypothetical protein
METKSNIEDSTEINSSFESSIDKEPISGYDNYKLAAINHHLKILKMKEKIIREKQLLKRKKDIKSRKARLKTKRNK